MSLSAEQKHTQGCCPGLSRIGGTPEAAALFV